MKIVLIGSPGSGKSTFAREFAKITGISVLHLDTLWHSTDYTKKAEAWFLDEQNRFMAENSSWLIDGGYFSCIHSRLEKADQIILLKCSKYKRIYRIIRRSLAYKKDKTSRLDMAENFSEKFDKEYLEFLKFAWTYDNKIESIIKEYKLKNIRVIENNIDKQEFFKELNI